MPPGLLSSLADIMSELICSWGDRLSHFIVYANGEVIKTYDLPYYYEPEVELLTGGRNVLLVASPDPEILGTLVGWCRRNNFYLYQAVRHSSDIIAIPCTVKIFDSKYVGEVAWQNYINFQKQLIDEGCSADTNKTPMFQIDSCDPTDLTQKLADFLEEKV